MFKMIDKNIHHTRGDTGDINFTLKYNDEPVAFDAVFSVKKNLKDTEYLFQKTVTNNHIHIAHEDTQDLPFGNYFYDIQIHIDDGTQEGKYITWGVHKYYLRPDVTT